MLRCVLLLVLVGCVEPAPEVSVAAPPIPATPAATLPPTEEACAAYEYEGATYDCALVDRCDTSSANLPYRLACCECDPELCLADPTCPDEYPELPPLPETCSPHVIGPDLGEEIELPMAWEEGGVTCWLDLNGVLEPIRSHEELLAHLDCGGAAVPSHAFADLDFTGRELFRGSNSATLRYHGTHSDGTTTRLILDTGCPYDGGPPPPDVYVAAWVPAGTDVDHIRCRSAECEQYSGPPLP